MTRGCQCRRLAFSSNEKRGRFGEQAGERIAAFAGGRHGGAARHPATRKKGGSPRDAMVAGADQEEPLPPQWPAHRAQIARRPAAGGLANAARIACGRSVASVAAVAAASACRSASGPAEILRRGKRAARVRACRPAARGEPARAALAALASRGERRLATPAIPRSRGHHRGAVGRRAHRDTLVARRQLRPWRRRTARSTDRSSNACHAARRRIGQHDKRRGFRRDCFVRCLLHTRRFRRNASPHMNRASLRAGSFRMTNESARPRQPVFLTDFFFAARAGSGANVQPGCVRNRNCTA